MTKSELIEKLHKQQPHLKTDDVELAVKLVLDAMTASLANHDRIEVRGFGSFSIHYRASRTGRNPRTGSAVELPAKHVPHFRPGKELRTMVTDVVPLEDSDAAE
jgi:integration host factor subunit beta